METKGLKILQNIKIRLINMIFTSKSILEKLKIFLLKMIHNVPINETIVANYEFCVNWILFLG
jgi:hypothetical protein